MSQHTFTLDGLEIDLEVEWEDMPDDDGCGQPSVTGNSMTGCRETRRVASISRPKNLFKMIDIMEKIIEHLEDQVAELEEED